MESVRRQPPTSVPPRGGSATSTGIVGIASPAGLDPGRHCAAPLHFCEGMIPMLHRYALALAAACAALTAVPATAANLLELNFYLGGPRYEGVLPPCDWPAALGKISARFGEKEGTFWSP